MELSVYTDPAVTALSEAQNAAKLFGHNFVGSEHLLMGLIKCGDETSRILVAHGVSEEDAAPYVNTVVGRGRNIFTDSFGNTQTVKRILELALYEAKSAGSKLIGTEHILLSIMRERDSLGLRIIDALCPDVGALRSELINGASETEEPDVQPRELPESRFRKDEDSDDGEDDEAPVFSSRQRNARTPVLDVYTRDLTKLAESGKLDPVIGRDHEISRVLQTLCRRTKNNPVLIGEPGVGKSAIAEGIALRIAEGTIPGELAGSRILSLDLSLMIAGTKYRGEFEERLKNALEEAAENSDIILFIDEIHTIIGAGAGEGSIDAANIMKPALARGEIRVIGATTVSEYRKYIEKDAALERRFTPVIVNEPDRGQTVEILKGLRSRYEKHHGVLIEDSAINAAVELSERFIADRRMPDKALDLLDEACAGVRIDSYSKTGSLEKAIEQAAERGDYELASRLRNELNAKNTSESKPTVSGKEVVRVVSDRTGMDVDMLLGSARFTGLEDKLNEAVFGQEKAVKQVSAALRRSAAGLSEGNKPFAFLIFAGPAGTGKKTLAVRLAETAFCGSYVRTNGSELSDEYSYVRIIGANAGTDVNGKGAVTDHVRTHPFSIVNLVNADKASSSVLTVFCDIAEKGIIEDGRGRPVSFKNCAVILCVDIDGAKRSVGFGSDDGKGESFKEALMKKLPEDMISLADAAVCFEPLDRRSTERIVSRELGKLAERAKRRSIALSFTDVTVKAIADVCGSSAANAEKLVALYSEDALSTALLNGEISPGDRAVIDIKEGRFTAERIG